MSPCAQAAARALLKAWDAPMPCGRPYGDSAIMDAIQALREALDAQGEAERQAFYEACRRYENAVAYVDDFPDDEDVDELDDAKDERRDACNAKNEAYRAMLAAERGADGRGAT